jgi:SRSO17 transposase
MDTSRVLLKRKLTGLILDETGVVKKGNESVGVGWQYCGNVGKPANSQVAVMACLCNGDFASLVDAQLYLPQDWINNPARCDKVGIPKDRRVFKTKPELATQIVENQIKLGADFDFVGADGLYGNDLAFVNQLEDLGCVYMLDIHKDQRIFLEKPTLEIPPKKGKKGRTPFLVKPDRESTRVDIYCGRLKRSDWQQINIRKSTKGKLKADFHFAKVYIWDQQYDQISLRLLVIRRIKTRKGYDLKYSFTNANLDQYTHQGLAYMQAQRYFVEQCFKESKQVLGLSQFQTRKWAAWEHQVAINIMIACFILKEKMLCFNDIPLLTAWDIREWICYKLSTPITQEQMIERISFRHFKRQQDINRCYGKQF